MILQYLCVAAQNRLANIQQPVEFFFADGFLLLLAGDLLHFFGEAVEDEEDVVDEQLGLGEGAQPIEVEFLGEVGVDFLVERHHLCLHGRYFSEERLQTGLNGVQ